MLAQTLTQVIKHEPLYSLEAELTPLSLADARRLSLPDNWLKALTMHDEEHRQALAVVRTVAGSPAAKLLRAGDLILAIDGMTVTRFAEVERAVNKPHVMLTILRDGHEQQLDLDTVQLDGKDVDRFVLWSGAVLQTPYRSLAMQRDIPPQGVFVSYFAYGTPASRYQLWAGRRIVAVDSQPTPDIDSFVHAIQGREDRSAVRLHTVTLNGTSEVITLKLDLRYWPAYELRRTESGWQRTAIN